ncbi:MAG: PAS domain-containing protein [Patescibacteria group bacterium]
MPKKSFLRSLAKRFSLEIVEKDIIKISGIVLTALIAIQLVFTKGLHVVEDLKSDVLGSHESAKTEQVVEPEKTEQEVKDPYQAMVENSRNIVLEWNSGGVITYINPFGAEFFGYGQKEIIGKSIYLLVPGVESESQRDLNQMLRDVQREPEKFENTANENIKKNGERVWIIWTNSEIETKDGTEILSIGRAGQR